MLIRMLALAVLLVGFLANYLIARQKFNRRSVTGREGFHSFEHAWLTRLAEKVGSMVAKLFILIGIFMLVLNVV